MGSKNQIIALYQDDFEDLSIEYSDFFMPLSSENKSNILLQENDKPRTIQTNLFQTRNYY